MSIALSPAPADADGSVAVMRPDDHRVALLTARTALEPELAQRYSEDPCSLLAEFGLAAAEPVYGMGTPHEMRLLIEDLDRSSVVAFTWCVSGDLLASAKATRR
ncbi:hypothetical protein [Streptomyces sp. NPDC046197]|uniref:hypothetical protein n=1 Tax=Streptomyces sp. NPDC046197 TaxID=3154337 RepID=UPI0033D405C2